MAALDDRGQAPLRRRREVETGPTSSDAVNTPAGAKTRPPRGRAFLDPGHRLAGPEVSTGSSAFPTYSARRRVHTPLMPGSAR